MEWSKAKSVLIILLLAANLYLGINIAIQLRERDNRQHDMIHSAWSIITAKGAQVDEELLSDIGLGREAYTFSRDVKAEKRAAEALLGVCACESPGGGIYTYTSEQGEMTFRSGGYVELILTGETEADISAALGAACRDGLEIKEEDEGHSLYMDSIPIVGASVRPNGKKAIDGSWIFGSRSLSERGGMDRAAMILALGRALSGKHLGAVEAIEEVYILSPTQSGDIRLIPAWKIEQERGHFYLSTVSGEEIS